MIHGCAHFAKLHRAKPEGRHLKQEPVRVKFAGSGLQIKVIGCVSNAPMPDI